MYICLIKLIILKWNYHIKSKIKRLNFIEVGQIFHSVYYGNIIATKVTKYDNGYYIYGFDETEGLPRGNYYPQQLDLIGKKPVLSDVLDCFVNLSFHKTSKETKQKLILDCWNYSKPYLEDQDEITISFLCTLINTHQVETNIRYEG